MNPSNLILSSPERPSVGLDDLNAQLQAMESAIADHFSGLLEGAASLLMDDPLEATEAQETGAFLIDDRTVVMRLNAQEDTIEFFVDLGLPALHQEERAYRLLLEMNLCRTHPGVVFGVHPESGRLVATMNTHAFMIADVQACVSILSRLARVPAALEEAGELPLE